MNQSTSIYERAGRTPLRDVRRLGALIGGGALAIYGISRRSRLGMALAAGGGALAYTGSRSRAQRSNPVAHSTVLLNCAPEEAYRFWRNFENLPMFMHHLESVQQTGDRRSKWIAIGPVGKRVSWEAEITGERENEYISWRSLPGSEIDVNGHVEFKRALADRGTIITARVRYSTPGGQLGQKLAKLMGKDPSFLMTQDLRRLKALIEAGEIPTTDGQSHGPRDRMTAVARTLDPDRPLGREARIGEVLSARRRVS